MSDTVVIEKPVGTIKTESTIAGVSVRAVLAMILVLTVCATHLSVCLAVLYQAIFKGELNLVGSLTTIGEPLYSLSIGAVAYYFGASSKNPNKV